MPRKARRRSWGSITEVIRGKKYVLRWVENTTVGRKRKTETFWGTYREADERLAEIRLMHKVDRPTMTFGEVARKWYIPWLEENVRSGKTKAGSAERYLHSLEKTILPRWSDVPIDSIKPLEVQEWLNGLTNPLAKIAIVVCRKAMDFPVIYEVVDVNKFRSQYEMPSQKSRSVSKDNYDLAKATEVFDRLHGSLIEPSFILSCFGSARVGESLAVKRSEVKRVECRGIEFAVVPIVRRMKSDGGCVSDDGDLKTSSSMRTLVIPPPFGTRLLEIAESGIVDGSEWLSPSRDGTPMRMSQLTYYWKAATVGDHIPLKNLRSSWRTFAQYEWGIDYDTCEVLMGHSLGGVTGRHYLRPTEDQLVEDVAKCLTVGINRDKFIGFQQVDCRS